MGRAGMPGPGHGLLARIERFSMPSGPVRCRGSWLRQQGEMRFAPDRPWLPFEAEEWFLGSGVDFRWQAKVRMAPLFTASVVDTFQGGRGRLTARILGVFSVARSRGEATDKAEALRGAGGGALAPLRLPRGLCPSPGRSWPPTGSSPRSTRGGSGSRSSSMSTPTGACSEAPHRAARGWWASRWWTRGGRAASPSTERSTA